LAREGGGLGEQVGPCTGEELEQLLRLVRLSRLSFSDEELSRLCV